MMPVGSFLLCDVHNTAQFYGDSDLIDLVSNDTVRSDVAVSTTLLKYDKAVKLNHRVPLSDVNDTAKF
jgi:hypothetical protein